MPAAPPSPRPPFALPWGDWLSWPTQCAICRRMGAASICTACIRRFVPSRSRCLRCALPLPDACSRATPVEQAAKEHGGGERLCADCLRTPPPFDLTTAALDYEPPWSDLIARFKFQGHVGLASALAQRLAQAVAARGLEDPPSLVVPVPLAPSRLKERGYNQAWELARRVATGLGQRSDPRLLLRIETGHATIARQVGTGRAHRLRNVEHAFLVEPARRAALAGHHVALVDDVMTTGATAWAAAQALKQAGAARVSVWTLARTARGDD